MKNFKLVALSLSLLLSAWSSNASALTCIFAKTVVKNGKATTTLSSAERTSCKKGEIPALTGATGEAGPAGADGATGPVGPAGPTYIRHTQNPGGTGITTSDTEVATFGPNANYSGSYTSTITHPGSADVLFIINVQVHVKVISSGSAVTCTLERNLNSGSFSSVASTVISSPGDAFMNASIPSFIAGSVHNFRTVCRTAAGGALVGGDMGAVAGFPS